MTDKVAEEDDDEDDEDEPHFQANSPLMRLIIIFPNTFPVSTSSLFCLEDGAATSDRRSLL